METTFDKDQRSIASRAMITENIAIELSTTWNKERKYYFITVSRIFIENGFQKLSVSDDVLVLDHLVPVSPRYSAKKLREVHAEKLPRIFRNDGSVLSLAENWAKGSVIAKRKDA